jgi:hypothetical protein
VLSLLVYIEIEIKEFERDVDIRSYLCDHRTRTTLLAINRSAWMRYLKFQIYLDFVRKNIFSALDCRRHSPERRAKQHCEVACDQGHLELCSLGGNCGGSSVVIHIQFTPYSLGVCQLVDGQRRAE